MILFGNSHTFYKKLKNKTKNPSKPPNGNFTKISLGP